MKTTENIRAENDISISRPKGFIYIPLVRASIHCESKLEKHDLQAGKSFSSNSTTSYIQVQKTKRNKMKPRCESRKMVLNQELGSR